MVLSLEGGFDPNYKDAQIAKASMSQADREALAIELYANAGYGPDKPLTLSIAAAISQDAKRRTQGVALI